MIEIFLKSAENAIEDLFGHQFNRKGRTSLFMSESIKIASKSGDILHHIIRILSENGPASRESVLSELSKIWPEISIEDLANQLDKFRMKTDDIPSEANAISRSYQAIEKMAIMVQNHGLRIQVDQIKNQIDGCKIAQMGVFYLVYKNLTDQMSEKLKKNLDYWIYRRSPPDFAVLMTRTLHILDKNIEVTENRNTGRTRRQSHKMRTINRNEAQFEELKPQVHQNPPRIEANTESVLKKVELPHNEIKLSSDVNLFRSMNQSSNDYLLDRLHEASILRDRYRKGHVSAEEFADFLSPVMVNLFKFFRSQGLQPEKSVGTTLTLSTAEEALTYDYRGTEFRPGEVKQVQVTSPGWRLGAERISRPAVRELPSAP